MVSPSPSPSFIPQSASDIAQLQLLHQIQNHQISLFDSIVLGVLLKFPLPESLFSVQQRLDMFNSYSSSYTASATMNSHPLAFATLIVFWPLWFILGLTLSYFLIKGLSSSFQTLFPVLFQGFIPVQPKTYLELTFPSDTSKSSYATSQLYTLLHTLARQSSFKERLLSHKKAFSLEIVSSKNQGIRYILATPLKNADVIKRSLLSYLPGIKIQEVDDYLESETKIESYIQGIVELKLAANFAFPLANQKTLAEHDPISYLTGNMTKLEDGELISFQVITTPVLSSIHKNILNKIAELRKRMYKGLPLSPVLYENIFQKIGTIPGISIFAFLVKAFFGVLKLVFSFIWSMILGFLDPNSKTIPFLMASDAILDASTRQELLNPLEQELQGLVKEKISQQLFETSIRILVVSKDSEVFESRISGLAASFGTMTGLYQSITSKGSILPNSFLIKQRLDQFRRRILSPNTAFNQNPVLSISELSDLYHFPYTETTKTEDLVESYSKELPAPLNLKQSESLDVTFAKNMYGGTETVIGLTSEERMRHMYLLGATGTGKSTLLLSAISQDIKNGKGVCLIDPHGDLARTVLSTIPKDREKDVIYFNPFDLKNPIAINLLEYTSIHLDEDDEELEKDFISESVVSIFRKIFSNEFTSGSAHRIEYVLRNSVQTALTLKERNLFTIYDLLNDPDFRRTALPHITDERLLKFWENEIGKAGDYQQVKMTTPITARIGRFLFSPVAKRILNHQKSSINFDQILDEGKILICNLSKGNIGEDTSQVLGILILARIQLAVLKRARIEAKDRNAFYLYVDEFQNFATRSFIDMMAESRKFGLYVTIAEQSTSQQDDRNLTHRILANIGTVICFKTANPEDEHLILPQFKPYIQQGEIFNLPSFHFYMKSAAIVPQAPFSGETMLLKIEEDIEKVKRIIESSRAKYTVKYVKPKPFKYVPKSEPTKDKRSFNAAKTSQSKPEIVKVVKPAGYLT